MGYVVGAVAIGALIATRHVLRTKAVKSRSHQHTQDDKQGLVS